MTRLASGNRFAIALLLCATIWMVLRVSGLFRVSPVQFPGWAGFVIALGILVGPLFFTLVDSLHWVLRLVVAVVFLGCAFVFPWFYDQLPVYFWLTMLLVYVEVFWVIPSLLKRRRSLDEKPQTGSGRSS
jgi:hypothetical protein